MANDMLITGLMKPLAKSSKPFRFDKVGFYDGDGNEKSGWLAKIETKEQLDIYYQFMASKNAQCWFDITASPQDKEGHCRTQYASVWKSLLNIEMAKTGRKSMSVVEAVNFIEMNSTKTAIKIFLTEGSVYVNKNGGCRHTRLRNDGRLDEHIFDTCTNKEFVFPSISKNEVVIKRWPQGKHFYILVDGEHIIVNGQEKFKTIEAAEQAKKDFLKQNRFKTEYLPNKIL